MTEKVFFFYLQHKVEVDQGTLSGAGIKAAIKSQVSDFDPTQELVMEGDPDKIISDADEVDLSHKHGGPKRFFSRPPTNFGIAG